jgi:hypothetical protein
MTSNGNISGAIHEDVRVQTGNAFSDGSPVVELQFLYTRGTAPSTQHVVVSAEAARTLLAQLQNALADRAR